VISELVQEQEQVEEAIVRLERLAKARRRRAGSSAWAALEGKKRGGRRKARAKALVMSNAAVV